MNCPNCGRIGMNSLKRCKKCGTIACYMCAPNRCPVCDKSYDMDDTIYP